MNIGEIWKTRNGNKVELIGNVTNDLGENTHLKGEALTYRGGEIVLRIPLIFNLDGTSILEGGNFDLIEKV